MKIKKIRRLNLLLIPGISFLFFSFSYSLKPPGGDWVAPASANALVNPVPATPDNIEAGSGLFAKYCKSCHGSGGKGDGTKASGLDTPCGDFTEVGFQSQTDGALFYKIKEGRDDMPTFKSKIADEEDIWTLVNYIRTFGPPVIKQIIVVPEKEKTPEIEIKKDTVSTVQITPEKTTIEKKDSVAITQDSISTVEKTNIENLIKQYENAINSSDTIAVTSLYTTDGTYNSRSTLAVGVEKIKDAYVTFFKSSKWNIKFSIDEIEQCSEMAFVRTSGKGEISYFDHMDKGAVDSKEFIFLKKIKGEWKIYCFLGN